MRWIANTSDPRLGIRGIVPCRTGQTQEEADQSYQDFLRGKVFGEPKATDTYTVEELKSMGLVGVYEP